MKTCLTIAGSDSGGGAGIQADLKTFAQYGAFGTSVITAITAQNTRGVSAVEPVSLALVRAQLNAIFSDFDVAACKTGMLFSAEAIALVASLVPSSVPLVVDPVMVAKGGARLLRDDAIAAMRSSLFPRAWMVTPNIPEAEALTGLSIRTRLDMEKVAVRLMELGPHSVLLKGGHLEGEDSPDVLASAEGLRWIEGPRLITRNTHGTGCTLSAAIAAGLATGIADPIVHAKRFLFGALERGSRIQLGHGHGPANP